MLAGRHGKGRTQVTGGGIGETGRGLGPALHSALGRAMPSSLRMGRYVCIHEQLNVGHLYAHLRGEITLGTYLLNREDKVRFVVLDHDAEDSWSYLLKCGARLAEDGIPAYLEKSRRGGHIWIFFKDPIAGSRRGHLPRLWWRSMAWKALKYTQSKMRRAKDLAHSSGCHSECTV